MELKRIKQLIDLMKKNELSELEIEEPDFRVKIKTGVPANIMSGMAQLLPPYSASLPAPEEKKTAAPEAAENKNLMTVKSPMVGTFYRSSSPDKPSYIKKEGVMVKEGQTLCIIEAMKLMNEIESPYEGKLVSILVKNAQPVEYDEPLFLIEVA